MNIEDLTVHSDSTIAVIGLGYVGLPLALEFANFFDVIGFDINDQRINELNCGKDNTNEVNDEALTNAKNITFTCDEKDISEANIFIVTVPTPISSSKEPNLQPLIDASKTVARYLSHGDFVIYESTVYPGATELDCVPILERYTGLLVNEDFYVGYSPERINPGDKINTLATIRKITSGSNTYAAEVVDQLYSNIISAGTYKAPSIIVAEAAKILENTQRDVNIGLMNEFSQICDRLEIDTMEVIDAAATKWNFSKYTPGLVGGHCIGVDPYYLIHRSKSIGYMPTIINSARILNEDMPQKISDKLIVMLAKAKALKECKVLVLGISFKENCPDLRNSKVPELIYCLKECGISVDVFDPVVNPNEVLDNFELDLIDNLSEPCYDALVFAVPHNELLAKGINYWRRLTRQNAIIVDLKSRFPKSYSNYRL